MSVIIRINRNGFRFLKDFPCSTNEGGFGSDARFEGLISPTLQTGSLRLVEVVLKDIGPCICTVQEDSFLTDWNDFFYNDTKLGVSDEMGKLFDS